MTEEDFYWELRNTFSNDPALDAYSRSKHRELNRTQPYNLIHYKLNKHTLYMPFIYKGVQLIFKKSWP